MKSFIEVQFPISRLSKECYKERMAGAGQTLTGLGKWWGRKPLILVRATILGLLMPSSDNPKMDMDIFLKILTMDDEGLWLRCKKKNKFTKESFSKLDYEERLKYCIRPEEVENLPKEIWQEINNYLDTSAYNLQELIQELGSRKFGNIPKVADVFCGGGSIPFEAARMGCEVYASDLNPVAGLLTWAALNILSKSDEEINRLKEFQQKVYDAVKKEIDGLGIEKNEKGWVADYFLYCNETVCPHCGVKVPLAPSWVISTKNRTIAKLKFIHNEYDIEIVNNVPEKEMIEAKNGTVQKSKLVCPNCKSETPISAIRGDKKTKEGTLYGLRMWESKDIVARKEDVFQERLYCIRYIDKKGRKIYCTPNKDDLLREEKALNIVKENLKEWQRKGYIPSNKIQPGDENVRLQKERGWTYWHHLFNPRQLLINGLFADFSVKMCNDSLEQIIGILGINSLANWNSRLCYWLAPRPGEGLSSVFVNQALNTMFTYGCKSSTSIVTSWEINMSGKSFNYSGNINIFDAKIFSKYADIYITDPPYADAVNYHELTEFFLSWDKEVISESFPEWYSDSKRALAVKGADENFRNSMAEIYRNLTHHLTEDGYQVIMFTHQDVSVWADLVPIIIKAGLQVCQAWTISTETDSGGLKNGGNYVKGTVNLILKKRNNQDGLFEDELRYKIKDEVEEQIKSMQEIDFYSNFNEQDYLLCSYATALKVLTANELYDIDMERELKKREIKQKNKLDELLEYARGVASNYLIPSLINKRVWNNLTIPERFFIKGLQCEHNGQITISTFQELARTFNIKEYSDYLQNSKANEARLKTASELKATLIHNEEFGRSILRNVFYAIYESAKYENINKGREWLKKNTEYEKKQKEILGVLDFLAAMGSNSKLIHWKDDSKYARLLYQFVANDGV